MARKKTVDLKNATAAWKALEKCADLFRDLWLMWRLRAFLPMTRSFRGQQNGGAPTQLDWLVDFERTVRVCYPDECKRKQFWAWMWSEPTVRDGNYLRKGTEQFAQRLGTMLLNRQMIPSKYFRTIARSKKDDSPVVSDSLPRQSEITKKYQKLRRDYEAMKSQRDLAAAAKADELNLPQGQEVTQELEQHETEHEPELNPETDLGYQRQDERDDISELYEEPFARQEEGLDLDDCECEARQEGA
jgi:hypothetical protein